MAAPDVAHWSMPASIGDNITSGFCVEVGLLPCNIAWCLLLNAYTEICKHDEAMRTVSQIRYVTSCAAIDTRRIATDVKLSQFAGVLQHTNCKELVIAADCLRNTCICKLTLLHQEVWRNANERGFSLVGICSALWAYLHLLGADQIHKPLLFPEEAAGDVLDPGG